MANSVRRRSSKKGSKKAVSKRSRKSSPPKRKASAKKGNSKRKKKRTVKVKAHSGGMVGGDMAMTKDIKIKLEKDTLLNELEYNLLKLSDKTQNYTTIITDADLWKHVDNVGIKIKDLTIKITTPHSDPSNPLSPPQQKEDGSDSVAKIVSVKDSADKESTAELTFEGLDVTP